jgi:hypothetical protein
MDPLRGISQGEFGSSTNNKVIALADCIWPIGALYLVTDVFEPLVKGDDEEQKERDVRNATYNGYVGFPEPPQGCDPASSRRSARKAKGECGRGRNRKQQ